MSSYSLIITLCIIIILSFFFNIIAKKTNIPSVIMLLGTGILLQFGLSYNNIEVELFQALEVLGIIGLIMIVLEAALDLPLSKEKRPIIIKSAISALIGLSLNIVILSGILLLTIDNIDLLTAAIYATPLSILSSAIIIPSVSSLTKHKREFMIYESTFSDILGIMVFYFLVGSSQLQTTSEVVSGIAINLSATVIVSIVASFLLLYMFQRLAKMGNTKFALFFAILILLYALGKLFHLSSLIIILIFGVILKNHRLILRGKLGELINSDSIDSLFESFKMMTEETAFVIRTLFFVIFGLSISLTSILDWRVVLIASIFMVFTYISRYWILKLVAKRHVMPETFIAPRGLISILLFYSIPKDFMVDEIESGILFLTIFVTSIIMGIVLIKQKKGTSDTQI